MNRITPDEMSNDSFTFTMYSSVEELSMVSQSPHQRTLNFLLGPCNYQKCLQNDYIVMSSKIPNPVSRQLTWELLIHFNLHIK